MDFLSDNDQSSNEAKPVDKSESTTFDMESIGHALNMIGDEMPDTVNPYTETEVDNCQETKNTEAPIDNPVKAVEPENIIRWRKERAERLKRKDSEEKCRQEEMMSAAKSQYETWLQNYTNMIEKSKKEKRQSNDVLTDVESIVQQKIGFTNSVMACGDGELTRWEYVAKLCDLNPNNRSIKSDVTRMRQLILKLKAEKFTGPSTKS